MSNFILRIQPVMAALLIFSSCAPEQAEKEFLPYVIQDQDGVKGITALAAETLCQANYCEKNQIYTSQFGRKRHTDPIIPLPVQEPEPIPTYPTNPVQPPEVLDYSRSVMNMNQAWSFTEGARGVVVAVIDSGVAQHHPDLKTNIDISNGFNFYSNRQDPEDDNGHGTHVSGIIAAVNNSIGTRGVAPNVRILPLKFLGSTGSGTTPDAIRAIDHAILKGAKIISNSWGGGGFSELLNQAIQRANAQGIFVVAAAGNEKNNNDQIPVYPANYPGVISVGSSDVSDAKSSFSNYGASSVTIFAPGSDIYSTYPGDTYRFMSGTSMATPQVSGAIALALSLRPTATRTEVMEDLCRGSANKLVQYSKCGRMDVGDFLRRVSTR